MDAALRGLFDLNTDSEMLMHQVFVILKLRNIVAVGIPSRMSGSGLDWKTDDAPRSRHLLQVPVLPLVLHPVLPLILIMITLEIVNGGPRLTLGQT